MTEKVGITEFLDTLAQDPELMPEAPPVRVSEDNAAAMSAVLDIHANDNPACMRCHEPARAHGLVDCADYGVGIRFLDLCIECRSDMDWALFLSAFPATQN